MVSHCVSTVCLYDFVVNWMTRTTHDDGDHWSKCIYTFMRSRPADKLSEDFVNFFFHFIALVSTDRIVLERTSRLLFDLLNRSPNVCHAAAAFPLYSCLTFKESSECFVNTIYGRRKSGKKLVRSEIDTSAASLETCTPFTRMRSKRRSDRSRNQ